MLNNPQQRICFTKYSTCCHSHRDHLKAHIYRKFFTIKYLLNTTRFFKKVLEEVSLIKFGKVKSYKQIAKILKNKNAYRAVANANARNPLPIIIPCHRVIRSSGDIGGYRGGIITKKYLLSFENTTGSFF